MPKLVFSSTDREEAHQELARLLGKKGNTTPYECREDFNVDEPYQVWDGAEPPFVLPPDETPPMPDRVALVLDEETLEALADKVAERMKG